MEHSAQLAALRALRDISKRFPRAEEYVMVHHPAFRVGKKPFAIAGMNTDLTVSINLGPEAQGHLLSDERFSKTPYLGQHGWVTVDSTALSQAELEALVTDSYRRVAGKKLLEQFDGAQPTVAPAGKVKKSPTQRGKVKRVAAESGEWQALGLSAPAQRALINAGFTSLRDLSKTSEASVRALHGMGPSGLKLLAAAMTKAKLRYAKRS